MALTLYTYPSNFRAWKVQIAAAYNGVTLDTQDSKELKTLFNKPPVLATPRGHLFESNAIARYVAGLNTSTNLNGDDSFQAAQVQQWIDFSAHELEPQRAVWLLPIRGVIEFNGKAYAEVKKDLKAALTVLNTHLTANTFLVGNHVTMADIAVACALVELFREVLDTKFRQGLENVVRWFTTCVNQKEFVGVLGQVTLAKKEKRAPIPKKKAEPAAAPKEQEQAPAAAKPAKKKNPLDELPKSSMSLDAVKKLLFIKKSKDPLIPSNPDFFKEFWGMFDDQGYSFWSAEYQYNSDNKEFWKTQNASNFFCQRLDAVRKYGMGVLNILGADDSASYFELNACFLVRGTEQIPLELKDVPDSDYYTFTKLPTATDADKKAIEVWFQGTKNLPSNPKDKKKGMNLLERRYFK
jgi:elongation factor 1-gamma